MKIAIFAYPKNPSSTTFLQQYRPTDDGSESYYCGMLRTTEWLEVEFVQRAPEALIPAQLAALDQRKAEEVERHLRALADIADERGKLLALTHSGEAA